MRLHSWLLFILSFLIVFVLGIKIDSCLSADISFEWSSYKPGECRDCTSYDLWKNHNIIVPDIPITQTGITIPLVQEQAEDDYALTAKNPQQRSGFSTIARVTEEETPIILKITQIK